MPAASIILIGFSLGIALLDWFAVALSKKNLEFIAKPGVMFVLLVWIWSVGGFSGHMLWFAIGVVFSLAGDIFLMLPNEQFIPGLLAFLCAHLAYIIGFNPTLPPVNFASLTLTLLVALTAAQIYRRLTANTLRAGTKRYKTPISVYTLVIGLMLLSALVTLVRPDPPDPGGWSVLSSLLVSSGALLFFLSDTLLAWNRFVAPINQARLWVIITYHLGQFGIVFGAALQFIL